MWVDNSLLADIAACSTRAFLTWQLKLKPPMDNAPLFAGEVIHEVIAMHFNGASLDECISHFIGRYYKFGHDNVEPGTRLAYDNVRIIVRRWLEEHSLAAYPFRILPDYTERIFAAELTPNIVFYGTIDLLGEDKLDGNLALIDNKTTGNIAAWWKRSYWQRSQFLGYKWLIERVLGRKVHTVHVNAIELSKLPMSSRKCKKHGVEHTECAPHHAVWEHYGPITYDDDSMKEWEATAINLARRYSGLLANYQLIEDLPKIRSQGMFNGGCTFCSFQDFCRSNRPLEALSMLFTHSARQDTQVRAALCAPGMRPYSALGDWNDPNGDNETGTPVD